MGIGAIIGGGLGLVGSIIGGDSQKDAARTASDTSRAVASQNNALARENRDLLLARADPFVQGGMGANALLNSFLGIPAGPVPQVGAAPQANATPQRNALLAAKPWLFEGMPEATFLAARQGSQQAQPAQAFSVDPRNAFANYIANSDYGFQFGEGSNALNSGYAGAGTLQSGAAMKDLERFRQNLQSGYRNEFLDRLSGQQGAGLSALGAAAGVGTNYVSQVSANNNAAGTAAANAALATANNPFANALGMIGGTILGRSI